MASVNLLFAAAPAFAHSNPVQVIFGFGENDIFSRR
jgi:hypothetical protein